MKIFFDVGTNYGEISLSYIEENGGSDNVIVFAFEPLPEAYESLKSRTSHLKNYHLFPYAVDIEDGIGVFNVSDQSILPNIGQNGSSSLLEFDRDVIEAHWPGRPDFSVSKKIDVKKIRLDTFIKEQNIPYISFLHIDTQGNDLNVLKSLGQYVSIVKEGRIEVPERAEVALYKGQHTKEDVEKWLKENWFSFYPEIFNQNEMDLRFKKNDIFDNISPDFQYIEVDGNRINKDDLLKEISSYSGNFREDCIYAFCEKLSLKQVILYLSCMYSGAIPVMVAHPSSKVSDDVFNQRLSDLKKKGVLNFIFDAEAISKKEGKKNGGTIAFCQLSSGTTGIQKCYGITYDQLFNQVKSYKETFGSSVLNVVSWLPLYHDMGLITSLFLPLLQGNKSVIIETFKWLSNPGSLFSKIDEHQGTHCWLPNFCFELLTKNDYLFNSKSNCEFINCSEPCKTSSVKRFIDKYESRVSACYAMAENVFAVSQSRMFNDDDVLMSCGHPINGTEINIAEDGEILIRGKCTYTNEYDLEWKVRDSNNFFATGDVGRLDENGCLYVSGRKKEMFIVSGKNIFANQIEQIVNETPGVKPGRCVAFSLPKDGTEMIVVMYEGDETSSSLISRTCVSLLDVSVSIDCVPPGKLIKTSSGKLCRDKNKDLYIKRREAFLFGRRYVSEKTNNDITKTSKLKSDGIIDSFGMMDLLFAIHKNANQQIDWTKDYSSIDTLKDMIDECF